MTLMSTTKDICKPFIDKAYKEGFIDGGHASGEQANEIHAIELHKVRAEERKKYIQRIKKLDKLIDWDKKTSDLLSYQDKHLKFLIIQEISQYAGINDKQTKALIKIIKELK